MFDVEAVGHALGRADPLLLAASVALLLPPFLASAWRLDWMAPPQSRPGVWRAFKLIMLACTLNMVLPSKMGDIAKARSEEHTSELQSLMRISYAVFCLQKKKKIEIIRS